MTGLLSDHQRRYEQIVARFVQWAGGREDIVAAMIVGSRARTDHPADRWSDLDLVIFADDPALLLNDETWLRHIGDAGITFREPTAVGIWEERRVLFRDGCDVDFSVLPASVVPELLRMQPGDALHDETAPVIGRGVRVIVDKAHGLADAMSRVAAAGIPSPAAPDGDEVRETLNDFWYHCVWIAKKLQRGEIAVAHEALEGTQRRLLTRLVRWHAGQDGTIWHGTRFLEEWASPRVREALPSTWARHDARDIHRALVAMMDLVAWLATELERIYPHDTTAEGGQLAREWVEAVMADNDAAT